MHILEELGKKNSKIQVIIFFNEIKTLQNFYTMLKNEKKKFVVNDS